MDEIILENISFKYPDTENSVFKDLSISLPGGVISLIGQNGTGKSTLLLLASGILMPDRGKVYIRGIDTAELQEESERQRYVSFVYQNMEFETEESIGNLLEYVYQNGFHEKKTTGFIPSLIKVFELEQAAGKKTQDISKGELQRTIIAFSLLYGSKILMMDEPIFSLEDRQKNRAMEFLTEYCRQEDISLYYSVHELDVSQKFSDYLLIFPKEESLQLGPTKEIFTKETIENAYQVPYYMLKTREALYRKLLRG